MTVHTGKELAELEEYMNPGDSDLFWISWTDKLGGDTIASDSWILPTGFTLGATQTNTSVTEDGVTYADANSAVISTSETSGKHAIFNEIVTAGGLTLRRGFIVQVKSI